MARLPALPSLDIIHGFKGVLDFYLWKGLPCVRSWPRMTKAQQSEGTKAASAIFGELSTNYRLLAPLVLQAFQDAAKDQPRTARDLYISAAYGHLHEVFEPPPPPPPEEQMYNAYVCLRDVKPQGTAAGSATAGTWQTRDLNEEQADPQDICTLAANQITLPAGSYRAHITVPGYRLQHHQARLHDVTNNVLLILGTSEFTYNDVHVNTRSFILGRFTLEAQTTLEVQHYCDISYADWGLGTPCNFTDEIYTIAEFWREVPPA